MERPVRSEPREEKSESKVKGLLVREDEAVVCEEDVDMDVLVTDDDIIAMWWSGYLGRFPSSTSTNLIVKEYTAGIEDNEKAEPL